MENEKINSSEEAEKNIESGSKLDKLDALLLNDDNDADDADYYAAEVAFDAFMAEYRDLINRSLADAAAAKAEAESQADNGQEEFLISLPKKSTAKSGKKDAPKQEIEKSEWDSKITLEPTVYEDLNEEEKPMSEEITEKTTPDMVLGEQIEDLDDQFQLSINFTGNNEPKPEEPTEKLNKYDPDKPRLVDWIFDIAEMFVFVLAAVMILTTFVFRHSVVEGSSMMNTLQDGDHLIISDLFYTPERGDIIVFEDYSTMLKKAVVKRVIGLPGETVEIIRPEGENRLIVKINGEELDEDYAYYAEYGDLPVCAPVTLGPDEIFVMGDNRKNSTDSRNSGVGPVKIDAILGKVIVRFLPFDKFGTID